MNTKKLVAFIFGILTAYALTAGIMTCISALWIWSSQWLMFDQGFPFWKAAMCLGLFTALFPLVRSIPELQKAAENLTKEE